MFQTHQTCQSQYQEGSNLHHETSSYLTIIAVSKVIAVAVCGTELEGYVFQCFTFHRRNLYLS